MKAITFNESNIKEITITKKKIPKSILRTAEKGDTIKLVSMFYLGRTTIGWYKIKKITENEIKLTLAQH